MTQGRDKTMSMIRIFGYAETFNCWRRQKKVRDENCKAGKKLLLYSIFVATLTQVHKYYRRRLKGKNKGGKTSRKMT